MGCPASLNSLYTLGNPRPRAGNSLRMFTLRSLSGRCFVRCFAFERLLFRLRRAMRRCRFGCFSGWVRLTFEDTSLLTSRFDGGELSFVSICTSTSSTSDSELVLDELNETRGKYQRS